MKEEKEGKIERYRKEMFQGKTQRKIWKKEEKIQEKRK